MGITSIQRDFRPNISIVGIETTNTLSEVAVSGYLISQEQNIELANNGPFSWTDTDFVLVKASDGFNFFTVNTTFTTLAVADIGTGGGGSGTVTSVGSGTGLTGGPITTTGTLSFASIAANSLWANTTGGAAVPTVTPLSTFLLSANNLSDVSDDVVSRTNLSVPATSTFAGDPNGSVSGEIGDFVVDTADGNILYMCTTAGDAASAVWELQGASTGPIVSGSGTDSAQGGGSGNASGDNSFAFGVGGVHAAGNNSVTFGDGGLVTSTFGFLMGTGCFSSGITNFGFGNGANVTGDFAFGMGDGVNVSGLHAFGFGSGQVVAQGDYSYSFGDGTGDLITSTAYASRASGHTTLGAVVASGTAAIAHGSLITASGDYSVCIGTQSSTVGDYAFSIGTLNVIQSDNSRAFGSNITINASGCFSANDSSAPLTLNVANEFRTFFGAGYHLLGGDVSIETTGKGLAIKDGPNCKLDIVSLIGGTVTVNNTSVTLDSRIFITSEDDGVIGALRAPRSSIVDGVSFVINSSVAIDAGDVSYLIVEPA